MAADPDKLIKYKILVHAPRNLFNDNPDNTEYYEIEATSVTWKNIQKANIGMLQQLAAKRVFLADVPPDSFQGGACTFVNLGLIVPNDESDPSG